MTFTKDDVINGRYRLVSERGRGTFGEVWLAWDDILDMEVALKIYIALDARGIEEFKTEFRTTFSLNHPNLLHASHFDVVDKRPYLVMPYCPASADELVGKISEEEAWRFIRDVSSGLAYLHSKDIIHRDIKPDNILRNAQGDFLISDFGVSVKMRSTLRRNSVRDLSESTTQGTIGYMGPEMFTANPSAVKATDIWALGATLYEMLEEELPFFGQGGVMQLHGGEIPDLKGPWSDSLKSTIAVCLSKETWERPKAEDIDWYASDILSGRSVFLPWEAAWRKKKEEDDKRRLEAERLRIEEERLAEEARRKAIEAERKRKEEETRKAAEAERKRKEEETRKAAEAERKRKEEEARKAAEAERKRKEEEARKAAEAERKRKEEEARKAAEVERKRKEEEARKAAEAERKRKEEEKHRKEEERMRKKEEKHRKEEEARKAAEEKRNRTEKGKKKGKSWLWVAAVAAVVGLFVWYLWNDDEDGPNIGTKIQAVSDSVVVSSKPEIETDSVSVEQDVISISGVTLSRYELTLEEGKGAQLMATPSPANASDKSVTWKSSAPTVASVASSGYVSARKAGIATITVTTNDGGKFASCDVTVKEKAPSLESAQPQENPEKKENWDEIKSKADAGDAKACYEYAKYMLESSGGSKKTRHPLADKYAQMAVQYGDNRGKEICKQLHEKYNYYEAFGVQKPVWLL